jgi:hypothetical protein
MSSPNLSLVQTNLVNLLAVSKNETTYFANALDAAVLAEAGMTHDDLKKAVPEDLEKLRLALGTIDHLEVIEAAIVKNPNQAARALLPTIYMNGAIISAQDRQDEVTGTVVSGPGSVGIVPEDQPSDIISMDSPEAE